MIDITLSKEKYRDRSRSAGRYKSKSSNAGKKIKGGKQGLGPRRRQGWGSVAHKD